MGTAMPQRPPSAQPGLTAALTKGFRRMLGAMPHRRATRGAWRARGAGFRRFFRRAPAAVVAPVAVAPIVVAPAAAAADPIAMVVMAIDRLGPAAIRASCSGV